MRFKTEVSLEQQRSILKSSQNLAPFFEAEQVTIFGVTVLPLREGLIEEYVIQTIQSLNSKSEVEFASPVFDLPEVNLIITDEFNAMFNPSISQAEIRNFNASHNVEIITGGTSEAGKSYFGGPVCETIVAGDINGDCKVNFLDFRLMAFHWLEDVAMVNSNAMVDAGIEYYVQTSKPVYTLGENVEMLFRVTNLTGEDFLIPCGGTYEFNFFVKKNGEIIWMEVTGLVDPSPGVTIMDGESVETGHNWNMKDINDNPVEPGVYNVVGVMYNGPTEVEVTITIIP